jgi:hypothetical protein
MNIRKTLTLLAPAALAMSTAAHAQVPVQQIRLGTPTYAGSGCPLGTTSASLAPDGSSLSILFGAFQANAGGSSGNTVDRKACNIAIPVGVPQGFTVSVIKIDYRGYNRLPLNASATFDVEYFFAGQNGPAYHKSFVGAQDGNFTLSNSLVATSTVWSPCGQDVDLRTDTNIAVQTNQNNEQTMFTLDSADISSGVVYQLQWQRCNVGGPLPSPVLPQPTPYQPQPTPYQPYPQPTPYNPHPQPTPYNPYPQPTPYQPYPQPTPVLYPPQPALGPCIINGYTDPRGFMAYMIKDGTGRVLGTTVQYAQAISIAQSSMQQGFCSSIVNNAPNPGAPNPYPAPPVPAPYNPNPYQPAPGPYNPNPYHPGQGPYNPNPYQPAGTYCTVQQGGNAYGQQFFRVVDRMGRIIYNASTYADGQRVAQTDQRCFQ